MITVYNISVSVHLHRNFEEEKKSLEAEHTTCMDNNNTLIKALATYKEEVREAILFLLFPLLEALNCK